MSFVSRRHGILALACAVVAVVALPLQVRAAATEPLSVETAGMWSETQATPVGAVARASVPAAYRVVQLDTAKFHVLAGAAPREADAPLRASEAILPLPLPDGGVARYRIVETPVMAPELAAMFPQIRTWAGENVDDPSSTIRLDWTPHGFHAMVLSPARGRFFVNPLVRHDVQTYKSYYARDYVSPTGARTRQMPPIDPDGSTTARIAGRIAARDAAAKPSGAKRRTYRLAVAATTEYTAFFGGTVPDGLAAIVTAINRINGIYEQEIAVRMQLVANNHLLVYTSTDPYTNDDGDAMLDQNQANITAVIGSANYDIGHVFSTGGGGIAWLGVACSAAGKAKGVTGSASPVDDPFYVDFVAHEMGHQLGANHTFNGDESFCGGGNRNQATSFEPGSGSTIMSYAGICASQDLQAHSDAYFHTASFDEIVAYTTEDGGSKCGTLASTGNAPPVVTLPAGGFTIPARTPFALMGSATDPDGDVLTYNWEEYDTGASPGGPPGIPTAAPFFRSWPATTGSTRIFPQLSDLLAGSLATGEVLPSASRTLRFRMTARDNRGGVDHAQVNFLVTSTAGPFAVTSPDTAVTWPGGSTQTVTWNVANTASAPVNCSNVDILLSSDGGQSFPTMLVATTPNDGSQAVTVPAVATATARVMVACSDSVFFDVSNADFTIGGAAPSGAAIVANPYGAVTVTGATLSGSTISGFGTNVTIQLGAIAGGPGSFAQLDFQALALDAGNTLTILAGAPGQSVVLRDVGAGPSVIEGALRAQGGIGGTLPMRIANPNGITIGAAGVLSAASGLEVDATGANPLAGGLVQNAGVVDGGVSLVVSGAGLRGGGAFRGDAMRLGTFGNANNPVNGNDFLANGLQLFPGTGDRVQLTLNHYGIVPQVLNLAIHGNGSVWMPSSWPAGVTLPPNNTPLAPGAVRPRGTPKPSYGGGSMIVQATGTLSLIDGGTHDFVFPGAIVLKAGGTLDVKGVLVDQGWTGDGQAFQGIFLESPDIASSGESMQFFTNYPNWVNFSTLPNAPVRAFTLLTQADGSASFVAADDTVPHRNTYSVVQGIAAAGGCWICAVDTRPIDVYGP